MKNNFMLIFITGVLVFGVISTMFFVNKKSKAMPITDETMVKEEVMEKKDVMEVIPEVMEEANSMEPEDETMEAKDAMEADTEKMMDSSDDAMMPQSSYVIYSPEKLSAAVGTRRVLYFYANWCPTCKVANEDLQENTDKLPKDVTVLRVNYNDTDTDQVEKDLAKKYGVTYQHTFVQIDENGEALMSWNGGEIDQLLTKIK